jgi:hypothetical protein
MLLGALEIVLGGPVDSTKTLAHFVDTGLLTKVGTCEIHGQDVDLYRITPQE